MTMKRLFGILVIPLLIMPSIVQAATYTPVYSFPSYTGTIIGPVEEENEDDNYGGSAIGPVEGEEETDTLGGSPIGPVEGDDEEENNDFVLYNPLIVYPGLFLGPVDENEDDSYGGSPIGPVEGEETEKDNYIVNISPSTDGTEDGLPMSIFNHDDKTFLRLDISEEDPSANYEIYSAEVKILRKHTTAIILSKSVEKGTDTPNGIYTFEFDLKELNLNYDYLVTTEIKYETDDNDYYNNTYDVMILNSGDTDDSSDDDGSAIGPVNSNTDNYTVIFNPEPVNVNGQDLPVHYFDEYRDNMRIDILEENRSSTATNRIEHISLSIYDENTDSRKMVYRLNRDDRSLYGLYTFQIDLDELAEGTNYYVTADITYADLDNLSNDYINRYEILRFVPKQDTTNPSTTQVHNLSYNVDRGTTEVDGQVVHLYGTDESVNVSAWQSTYAYNAPVVTDIHYYINGDMVQDCLNVNSCNLNHKLTVDEKVNITIRANYKDYDEIRGRFTTYTHNYDLGFFLMKADSINDDNADDTTNNTSGTTDTTSTNNDTLLSMNQYLLLKGSSASVFLVNQHNHRFLMPDWSVLKSWYYQPNIIQVNDAQLGQYTLLDNVIYRPGSLIKIATDPKCYTVGLNGTLHWVYNEDVARALYGTSWNQNIYIVPDSLFPSYSFGDDILNASDYEMPSFADAANMYNY